MIVEQVSYQVPIQFQHISRNEDYKRKQIKNNNKNRSTYETNQYDVYVISNQLNG